MQQPSNIEWIDIGLDGLEKFIPGIPKGDAISAVYNSYTKAQRTAKSAYTSQPKKHQKQ
jgi:hypothetical protein